MLTRAAYDAWLRSNRATQNEKWLYIKGSINYLFKMKIKPEQFQILNNYDIYFSGGLPKK